MWDALGIDPTSDRRAIRRAYAKKLKLTNPEDDAEGFKALREAYEAALQSAKWLSVQQEASLNTDSDPSDEHGSQIDPAPLSMLPLSQPYNPGQGLDVGYEKSEASPKALDRVRTFVQALLRNADDNENAAMAYFERATTGPEAMDIDTTMLAEDRIKTGLSAVDPAPMQLIITIGRYYGWFEEPQNEWDFQIPDHVSLTPKILSFVKAEEAKGAHILADLLGQKQTPWTVLTNPLDEPLNNRSSLSQSFTKECLKLSDSLDAFDPKVRRYYLNKESLDWWKERARSPRLYWRHIIISACAAVWLAPDALALLLKAAAIVFGQQIYGSYDASFRLFNTGALGLLFVFNLTLAYTFRGLRPRVLKWLGQVSARGTDYFSRQQRATEATRNYQALGLMMALGVTAFIPLAVVQLFLVLGITGYYFGIRGTLHSTYFIPAFAISFPIVAQASPGTGPQGAYILIAAVALAILGLELVTHPPSSNS